jgi:hypothetical protein
MNGYIPGLLLIIVGAALFVVSRLRRRPSVSADRGSVAIGGDSSGSVTNINIGKEKEKGSPERALTVISILVEVIGIAAVIWHATHLAAK